MVSEAPPFWWKPSDWRPYFLYPLSYAYGRIASRRLENAKRQHVDAPVGSQLRRVDQDARAGGVGFAG